jgi:hypothetical protein
VLPRLAVHGILHRVDGGRSSSKGRARNVRSATSRS